jgi:hypothetical protein
VTTHAPIGFSKLPRITRCPGSRALELKAPPEKDSEAAIEGRVAHWVAYQKYNGIDVPVGTEKDGIKVDEDMLVGAQLWVDSIPQGGVAEMPVMAPSIHPTDCWGTPDLWFWDPIQRLLTIPEYKYGYKIVDEFENEQLIGQAAGIMDTCEYVEPLRIKFVIVQPFGYVAKKVREWEIGIDEFPEFLLPIIGAVSDGVTTNVGPHCLYCPAREICTTFQMGASQVVHFSGLAEAVTLTPEQMGAEYTVLCEASKILEARKTVLGAMVEDQVRKGVAVPGWGMDSKASPLAWLVDKDVVLETGKLIGVNLAKPAEPITPTQARDRKLLDEETLKGLASRPPSAMKLKPISTALTRRIFK